MSRIYKSKLSPYKSKLPIIKEPLRVTFERLDPKTIMFKGPRIHGAAPPISMEDAHDNPVKYPKPNPARRSRKCRRKKRRKTKRNLAGCACRDYRNCDCIRRALIGTNERRLREQRAQEEREEWLRQENLRILNDAKQYNLKDEDGNHFTIENLEEAKRALSNYLQEQENHRRFNQALMDESLPTADVAAVPMGIPIPTTRWQKIFNFIKKKTRKVHPVLIVNESGKRKTCKKKRKRRTRRNTGKGSGASKPYKPNYTQEQLLINEAQNIIGNITTEMHTKLNFNDNKGSNQKYEKMYDFIVNRANLKKIENRAQQDAFDQVFGTTTDDIVLNPNEGEGRRRKKNVAGENNMCKGIHNFLKAQKDPSFDEFKILPPFVSTMDANRYCRRRNFKRCDFDEGKCIEPIDTTPIWLPPPPPLRRHNGEARRRRKRTRRKRRRKRR